MFCLFLCPLFKHVCFYVFVVFVFQWFIACFCSCKKASGQENHFAKNIQKLDMFERTKPFYRKIGREIEVVAPCYIFINHEKVV